MKVFFDTFGCRLSRAEALQQEADYLAAGWELAVYHADADLIIVRGCSVTSRAQRDCEKLIEHLRKKYPTKRVHIEGCLKDAHAKPLLPFMKAPPQAGLPTRTARAYLKVQDGCSGKCTFCIVPQFRGVSISTDFDEVLARAKKFRESGYHELVVTGCNLALYASHGKRLPDLLAALAELSPDCRVRLGSLEPGPIAMEVLDVFAAHENLCRELHLPIQSGSNRILMQMKRPYLIHDVVLVLDGIQKRFGSLFAVGCDLMTGFPGENEIDFLATKSLFKRFTLAKAHVFPFSERPDTPAANYADVVPRDTRLKRAKELIHLAEESRSRFLSQFHGRTVEVIVEDEDHLAGWTSEHIWCQCGTPDEAVAFGLKTRSHGQRIAARKERLSIRVNSDHNHILYGVPTHGW